MLGADNRTALSLDPPYRLPRPRRLPESESPRSGPESRPVGHSRTSRGLQHGSILGPTICPNNCVSGCPEASRLISRLRPDTPIYQRKRDDTGFDGTARDHSERSDNAEVASSILASPTR
jgi:hypothetical protein